MDKKKAKKAFAMGTMLGIQIALQDGERIREFIEPERGIGQAAITAATTTTAQTISISGLVRTMTAL
jgi:hypothetical protein